MSQEAATVYITLAGRFEEFERRINQLEAEASDAGDRAGQGFGGKFKAGLAIAAGGAIALGGALAAALPAMNELAAEADKARASHEMFAKTLERTNTPAREAQAAVAELAEKLKVSPQIIEEGMTTILRAGGTLESASKGLLAAGASAAAAGNDIGTALENAAVGIGMGRSEMLEAASVTVNASDAYKEYAKSIGVKTDALTESQKVEAYANAIYKESRFEVDDLSTVMGGLAGQQAEAAKTSADMRKEIGTALLPIVQAFGQIASNTQAQILGWVKSLDKEQITAFAGQIKQMADIVKNVVSSAFQVAAPIVQQFAKFVFGVANEAAPVVNAALRGLATQAVPLLATAFNGAKVVVAAVTEVFQKLSSFAERNREVLIPLTAAVGAGAAAFGLYRAGVLAVTAAKAAWTVATTTATTASIALRAAITFLTGPIGLVITAVGLLVGAGVALYRNWDEIKAFAGRTWGAIKEIVANAINGAVAFLRGVDMRGLGLDIVQGLVNGILAGPRLVLAAARGLGSAVINGVKGILNIQSPSRVMQELGEFTAQGFVKGIESQVPSVRKAAQETSKAFLEALGDLKLERETGGLNLTTYTRTLEQAAVQLRAKLKTVQEGTPAYSDWLKALKAVTTELDGVKGKATETQTAAKQMADEMARNRAQIVQGEAMERYVQGLRSATAAQLQHALETARARGETERYNAIRDEMKRRTEAATTAQEKATEAARNHQQQLADNRAQIAATEAQERYIKGLRAATDAQLASALQTARTRGEVERYNAIRDEQKRRAEAVASAEDKAAEATRRAAEAVEQGRKAIADAREYDTWKAAMQRATDDQLASGLAAYEAAGNQQRYNDVLAEQKRRADEAAAAVSVLVDEQIKAANAQYANVQAAADMAYRQSYGVGEGGLVSALSALTGFTPEQVRADVERALTELERLNPGAAAIVGRVYADVLAEQRQAVQEQQSLWNIQAEGNKRAADTAIAEADRLSKDGDWSGAARVLEDALDDLYAAAEGGEDAADAINAVTDALNRLAAARAGLKGNDRTLADWRDLVASGQQDPMMDGPVEARGTRPKETPTVVSPPRVAPEIIKSWDDFSKAIAKAEWVRETTDELKAMDAAQLAHAKTLAISSRDLDRYNLVLAEEERRAKAAAEGSKLLADLTREAARAAGETQRPYADQIAKLTELRGVVGVNQVELEKLILKFQELQAQAEKQQGIDKMVSKINEFSNYARQAIPIVTGAMQALGGVTGEVADQWASDLGSMVGDITNIATAIAKGDWIGAAVQGLMSIFNWFNRNAEAASKAAKATADYNNQFKFAQGTAGGNYGTRTTGSYTTGFLFWSTTHYTEQIDQMKKDLALAAENGFVNGMKSGFNEALAKSDFSLFEKSLKTSVGRAVLDGLIDSFINQAIIAKIIGPAIDAYLKTGDTAALRTAIQAASGEARKFYDDVLAPIAQEFGLLGTDAAKPAPDAPTKPESDIKTIKVEMPTVSASLNFDVLSTLATVVERAAPRIETGGLAMVDGANRLLIAADRFERVVTGLELTPQGFRS